MSEGGKIIYFNQIFLDNEPRVGLYLYKTCITIFLFCLSFLFAFLPLRL